MLAQNLGISLVTNVIELKTEENSITAVTRGGTADIKIPVLMTAERCRILRFPSIFSKQGNVEVWNNEKIGCIPERCGINGSPNSVLKVGCGSLIPRSVPASLEVNPVTKWYIAAFSSSLEIGGSTPKASAVRKITTFGIPPFPGICALSI